MSRVKILPNNFKKDLWDCLSEEQIASVSRAKIQLANGEGVSHYRVMANYKKWRKK